MSCLGHLQCPKGFIGNGKECSNDTDLDGVPDIALSAGCPWSKCVPVSITVHVLY